MADNQFKVILSGDSSQLQAALNNALKSVQDFSIKVGKLPQVAFSTQGIDNYKKAVSQLKTEVSTITTAPLQKALSAATALVDQFGASGSKASLQLNTAFQGIASSATIVTRSLQQIPSATNGIAAATPVLNGLSSALLSAAAASLTTGNALGVLGSKLPVSDLVKLRASVAQLKKDLQVGANVKIQINTGQITLALDSLSKDLTEFKVKLSQATDPKEILRLNRAIAQTQSQIKGLKSVGSSTFEPFNKAVAGTTKGLTNLAPASAKAGRTLIDLSRVAQDAPFGFIGIANNIDPLLQSFQALKKETGSTGGALKALGAGLMGPGGIAVGLSVVTSLIIAAIQKYGSLGNAMNVIFGLTTNLQQANRELAASMASSAASVAGEVATIQSLVNIARDKTLSDKARGEAINKLNEDYDKYLPKLTLENVETEKVTKAVNELTKSLVRKAKIQGIQDLISKETAKQAEEFVNLTDKMSGSTTVLEDFFDTMISGQGNLGLGISRLVDADKIIKNIDKSEDRMTLFKGFLDNLLKDEAVTGNLFDDDKKKIVPKGADQELKRLNNELSALKDRLTIINKLREAGTLPIHKESEALQTQFDILKKLGDIDAREVTIKAKPKLEINPDLTKLEVDRLWDEYRTRLRTTFDTPIVIDPNLKVGTTGFFEKLKTAFENSEIYRLKTGFTLPLTIDVAVTSNVTDAFEKIKEDVDGISFEDSFSPMVERFKASASAAKTQMEADIKSVMISLDIASALTDAFSAAGEAVGEALIQGKSPLAAGAEAFLKVVGAVVSQFGKEMIAIGTAMLIAKKSIELAKLNPAVAIVAGTALTVLGGALKNIKFNVPGAAEGGILTGPKSGYLAMLHGTEMITPIDKVGKMAGERAVVSETVHVIKGSELHLLTKTYEGQRRRGL